MTPEGEFEPETDFDQQILASRSAMRRLEASERRRQLIRLATWGFIVIVVAVSTWLCLAFVERIGL